MSCRERHGAAVLPDGGTAAAMSCGERWRCLLDCRQQAPGNSGESGEAIIEFVGLTAVLLIPLIGLVMLLAPMQAASFGSEAAARAAATTVARGGKLAQAQAAAKLALADQGFTDPARVAVNLSCPRGCQTPGAMVTVQVGVKVPLPLVPKPVGALVPLEVPVTATHIGVIDRFRDLSAGAP